MLPGADTPDAARDTLALLLTPGVGPVRLGRLLEHFRSPDAIRRASPEALRGVTGVGPKTADAIARPPADLAARVNDELAEIERLEAHVLIRGGPGYPPLLADLADAPPLLLVKGEVLASGPAAPDSAPLGMVGARECSIYGIEQARRFASAMAHAGVTVVSGGARGIDGAAHEAALAAGGRTIVVLGCGLSCVYPPEHAELFERIVRTGRGAVVSELPMRTPPIAENFPARNRIISGLSLGVLVIEAGRRSGALITARVAVEEHGRDVMAIPGRVTDAASAGTLDLIKSGGAALVTEPADVLALLAEPARRHALSAPVATAMPAATAPASSQRRAEPAPPPPAQHRPVTDGQAAILDALQDGPTFDELLDRLGGDAATLRAAMTMLEVAGLVKRSGSRLVPTTPRLR